MPYQQPMTTLWAKRIFDVFFAGLGLLLLSPFFLLIALAVKVDSKGPVFFKQARVGKNDRDFLLWKFRTMVSDAHKKGLITVGGRDSRVTAVGYFLRQFKLDELPQLINVVKGDMSIVGPRPEVRHYVEMYTREQKEVLNVKPGLTDFASIEFANENELLGNAENPEQRYIQEIMPQKIELGKLYISKISVKTDLKIIFLTLKKIFQ